MPPSSVSVGTAPVSAAAAVAAAQQQHNASIQHQDGTQPFKKIRLQEYKEQMPPLRIDTRDQPGSYNPQVEAISPTLPDHIQEDQAFKTTKDELLQQISKVDREIAKAEAKIQILKKKELDLEELASKPLKEEEVEEITQPKHQSLAQKIYAENRKKAIAAHTLLGSLGPKVDWPIYNQPSDTSVYHENKRRHQIFKRKLLEYFKKRQQDKETRENYLIQTYSKLMQEWLRKVDKIESSQKRKAKETKNREFFEKVFPELRKQREDKERFNRVGARIKSEADLEEIMDGLQEQEMEDKKMRSYAVIPPILLNAKQRKLRYINNNGHVEDMENEYKERKFINVWTNSENEIFKEKYLQHPKNFGVIASYLDRKSVQDCVQHYYLTKKQENYKQLLRKSRQRTRSSRNNPQKVNNTANNSVIDLLTTGVTTRLQREQQQKTGQTSSNIASSTLPQQNETHLTSLSATITSTTNNITSVNSNNLNTNTFSSISSVRSSQNNENNNSKPVNTTASSNNGSSNLICSTTNNSPSILNSNNCSQQQGNSHNGSNSGNGSNNCASPVGVNSSNNELNSDKIIIKENCENDGTSSNIQQDNTLNSDQSNSGIAAENKKKKERRKDTETTDDENLENQDKSASSGICIVCKSQLSPLLQSRPLIPSQASQYNLVESDIPANARVCNNCRCKCVRSRYTHCPLPTCPNARGRVKRLRSLPQKWQEITEELRQIVTQEFGIPPNVTKCCSACFNRIQRRLGAQEDWPDEEVNHLKMYLSEIGAVWTAIGERLGRPGHQVKSFYSANRKRFNLEACLGDRKPQLTDDDESGSSTSSCEELLNNRERHSSDTASAESPSVQQEPPQGAPQRKEDYDSSATETADEGQTPDHYQSSATITVVNSDGQQQEDSSPMTVKDLMSNVIELQLMKNSGGMQNHPPTTGGTPTISSILNMSDSNDVTIIREYNLKQPNQQPTTSRTSEINLATLVTPLIAATITPVSSTPQENQIPPPREELVVLQVQDGREQEPLTLDLSIKKPRELPPPPHHKHPQIHRTSEPYIQYQHERKSPAVYVSTVSQQRNQPKLPSPKPANPKAGSITLGTPIVTQQSRYEGLLRQMTPETHQKMGSITQGTPIHIPPHIQQDKRVYELYNKRAPPQQPQNFPQYRPSYAVEQQLSSRQIIMNDYITSQQMHGARRVEKPPPQNQNYYSGSPHRTPPPPQQPQRQGVIQRHTRPNPTSLGHYPPGHEALSSLVDVAVQQPSLPVPPAPHEGLGKTIADHLSEPHRFQLHQQMHQQQLRQQRLQEEQQRQRAMAYREQQHNRERQQNTAREGSSTLTAASLIDAIITHQINQSADGAGREVVQNNREPPRPGDRLFQGFQQPENNGERSPSIIQVDLSDEQSQKMTVKDITDSVISMDFSQRGPVYYQGAQRSQADSEEWKRRVHKEDKRSMTPATDERQIIRIAQPQKYQAVSPVSPENNHWGGDHPQAHPGHDYRRFAPPPQAPPTQQTHTPSHISALDYVKHRIVEVMRTEDDKRDPKSPLNDKDRSDSPGDMVIDEDKQEFNNQNFTYPFSALNVQSVGHSSANSGNSDKVNNSVPTSAVSNNIEPNASRTNEPKPLLSAQYEPLSDED